MNAFSFRPAPTYRAASPDEQMTAAFDMPMSLLSTLGQQAKGGVLDSFGLGTAIRNLSTPEGERTTMDEVGSALRMANPITGLYEGVRGVVNAVRGESKALTEDEYKSSPYYRDNVKWDAGMTEDRAASLAESYDAKRVRDHFASKRPITSFIGNLAGQAIDPINYIPVLGPAVKAANVARFGRIGGAAITNALDAAANTAIAGGLTYGMRKDMGDDITWQSTVSEIAMSALIGGAFGTVSGVLDARRTARVTDATAKANEALSTLKNVQDARVALNSAIDGLVRGEDVSLSANAADAVQRLAKVSAQNVVDVKTPLTMRPDFNEWFGGSQVVDDSGAPLVAYHGTGSNFDAFALDNSGSAMDAGKLGRGFYFSTRPDIASGYANAAGYRGGDPNVMPVYLAIKKPVVFDAESPGNIWDKLRAKSAEWGIELDPVKRGDATGLPNDAWSYAFSEVAQERGFDGVILKFKDGSKEIVAFNPTQIKSSLNRGSFSAADDKIINLSPAKPDAPPMGRMEAEARVATPENYKAVSEQYRVNPDDGTFIEQADVDRLRNDGRLTPDDEAALVDAEATYENGVSYGEALRAVVGCLIA